MPEPTGFPFPHGHEQVQAILIKILSFQETLPDGRAVELEELRSEGVLSLDDLEFLRAHSVTYKPHKLTDHHAGDMISMPTEDGACVFIGPNRPPPLTRQALLPAFEPILHSLLSLPKPADELLVYIEFTERDGLGISPVIIGFTMQSVEWRQRLADIRSVASELSLEVHQDEEIQGAWALTFYSPPGAKRTTEATLALLCRGCELGENSRITYQAGALDSA